MLIALDIDGTIIDWSENLSERVEAAIRGVVEAGHDVVLATGRSLWGTTEVLQRLGLTTGWAVCSNGSVTLRLDPRRPGGYAIADVITFDPAPALKLLREYLPDALYLVEGADVEGDRLVTAAFPDGELTGPVRIVPFEDLLHRPATRVVVRSVEHTNEEFGELVAASGLHGVSYAVGWTAWLDLAPDGVSKASALDVVRARLGVPREQTLAVGDGSNDLEMFAWAARAVAMGQAREDVRAAADEVTASIEDDGLALVLEPLLRTV
ncbi:MAG: HAD family phosphatase [Kineosporiaceae bacterium]|nr:HAD family phosphatase [Kineosporiaceae bacterium]